MLFKKKFLSSIANGKVKSAFRKWSRPSVRANGTLMTSVGQLRILSLVQIDYGNITDYDIEMAGYRDRLEFDQELSSRNEGVIYKITFELERVDPRIALRENTHLSEKDLDEIIKKLQGFDSRAKVKNWTLPVLEFIAGEPGKKALECARALGLEKMWFKQSVRKLKNLGLTISLEEGYEISPRGQIVLKRMLEQS